MISTCYLALHLGLGDAFVCNGLVRALATRYQWLVVPAKRHYRPSVAEMLSDLVNVSVVGVEGEMDSRKWVERFTYGGSEVVRLGLYSNEPLRQDWDKQLYEQAEVPFELRWKGFKLPWSIPASCPNWPAFVHEDASRKMSIDAKRLPREHAVVQNTGSVWTHLEWLQNAPEIHCIDSCFLCLADSVETRAKKLVFHRYARPDGKPPTLRKDWRILSK